MSNYIPKVQVVKLGTPNTGFGLVVAAGFGAASACDWATDYLSRNRHAYHSARSAANFMKAVFRLYLLRQAPVQTKMMIAAKDNSGNLVAFLIDGYSATVERVRQYYALGSGYYGAFPVQNNYYRSIMSQDETYRVVRRSICRGAAKDPATGGHIMGLCISDQVEDIFYGERSIQWLNNHVYNFKYTHSLF
ncbi:OLC1v1030637C1 [Oldenlandia corymbosa var. corymbosa]|uniref:OLC1v1030637C1 n=1 Tax=Oldenlandia corymbosa var. corymbosa TaxID=529605 RepID=A0AAV1CIC7_OLDCO|nr:OLC1v1030637C1 [Oldenlandia corymbosa var. corymbosa]